MTTSCKKERSPRLIIHVQEENGFPASGARVRAWYGNNAGNAGSVLNDVQMDQTLLTNAVGDVTFDFEFSAVLDIDVTYYKNGLDTMTPPNEIVDTMYGHRVVKIETVRQKSKTNNFNETVEVK